MEVTKLCVLRSGGQYTAEHAQRLMRQVPGLVCLSDQIIRGAMTIPLKTSWPGWWAKMELFDPGITGPVMYYDLDTTVFSEPDTPDRTTVLTNFYFPKKIGSGLMFLTDGDRARVWEAFVKDPRYWMKFYSVQGDQAFIEMVLGRGVQRWQDFAPGQIASYKVDCEGRRIPPQTRVVCFHGKPKPWDPGVTVEDPRTNSGRR
jgi:hypothetical protein